MQRRDFLTATTGLAVSVAAAGCSTAAGGDHDVGMQSNAFVPTTFEARVGDEVVWRNTGSRNHTVTGYDDGIPEGGDYFASGGFDSETEARDSWAHKLNGGGTIHPGETYSHVFEVPGEFTYFCIPHEPAGMVGKVVVRE